MSVLRYRADFVHNATIPCIEEQQETIRAEMKDSLLSVQQSKGALNNFKLPISLAHGCSRI